MWTSYETNGLNNDRIQIRELDDVPENDIIQNVPSMYENCHRKGDLDSLNMKK